MSWVSADSDRPMLDEVVTVCACPLTQHVVSLSPTWGGPAFSTSCVAPQGKYTLNTKLMCVRSRINPDCLPQVQHRHDERDRTVYTFTPACCPWRVHSLLRRRRNSEASASLAWQFVVRPAQARAELAIAP